MTPRRRKSRRKRRARQAVAREDAEVRKALSNVLECDPIPEVGLAWDAYLSAHPEKCL